MAPGALHEGLHLPQETRAFHPQVAELDLQLHHVLLGLADHLLTPVLGLADDQLLLPVGPVQYVLAGALGLQQGLAEDAVLVLVLAQAFPTVEDLLLQFLVLRQQLLPFGRDFVEEGADFGFLQPPEGLLELPALDIEGRVFHGDPFRT